MLDRSIPTSFSHARGLSEHHPSLCVGPGSVKRLFDCALALAGLLALLPLLVVLATLVKLDSPGPVLFKQRRAGLNGTEFWIYKFRSMHVDAEARQAQLQASNEMNGPIFKIKNDPRVTRFGRWLRRTSMDEWPQLLNVLKGEMSLVGPRPLPVYEVECFEPWQMEKLAVRPGITGLWQVSGRNDLAGFDQMLELDLCYIRTWSLRLDFEILCRTLPTVIKGKGAH